MKIFRVTALLFVAVALILSHAMCANVAFQYCNMLWGIEYGGYSAPANTAYLLAIPYLLAIIITLTFAVILWQKAKR